LSLAAAIARSQSKRRQRHPWAGISSFENPIGDADFIVWKEGDAEGSGRLASNGSPVV
jgi:hypothetical protein